LKTDKVLENDVGGQRHKMIVAMEMRIAVNTLL